MENKALTSGVVLGLLLVIAICLWKITSGPSTQTEALLLSVVLTLCSVAASWVLSRFYADYSHSKNLRFFALKAAEKVTNLSDELVRLSGFLQQELESDGYESPKEELLAKDGKIESAIHIINTLKSVNDRSLSDWQGVIGDEITAQREAQEEREETLRELLQRLESLPVASPPAEHSEVDEGTTDTLRNELDSIRKEVRVLAAQVSGIPFRATKKAIARQRLTNTCPACRNSITYRQRPRQDSVKAVTCSNCGTKLYSQYRDGDFVVRVRQFIPETVRCPACQQDVNIMVDPVPGTQQENLSPMPQIPPFHSDTSRCSDSAAAQPADCRN